MQFLIIQMKPTRDFGIDALRYVNFIKIQRHKNAINSHHISNTTEKGLFKYCKSRGMKVSDDLNLQTFPNVFVKEALPRTFNEMHGHFDSVIKNAQKSFLANRRAVDVQNMSGVAMKCDVKLSEQYPDQYVNVWPHSDRCLREGVPLNRGKLVCC